LAIKYNEAIRAARDLIGTPYDALDCINLIKKIIRSCKGGMPGYTTATTVSLWESIGMSAKYKDLTWRQESIAGAKAGMVAFKRYNKAADHVGLVTERGTVVHSSSENGRGVVETPLTASEGWNGLGIHRYLEVAENVAESEEGSVSASYKAKVKLSNEESTLNVRDMPSTKGRVINELGHGAVVQVQIEFENGWRYVSFGDSGVGYVSGKYLERYEEPVVTMPAAYATDMTEITIIDSAGNMFRPVGDFKVYRGSID